MFINIIFSLNNYIQIFINILYNIYVYNICVYMYIMKYNWYLNNVNNVKS